MIMDATEHGFDTMSISEMFGADGRSGRGEVAVKKPNQFRQRIPHAEMESFFLHNTLLPGVFYGLKSLILPGNIRF